MRFLPLALLALLALSSTAEAQSSCPAFAYGRVLTAAQWQACFDAKQNSLGYTPVNKAGDTMVGRLIIAAPSATIAGINLTPGSTPSAPLNGDVWITTSGMFARAGGVTYGPFVGASGGTFAATLPLVVSFPAGVVTYALNYNSEFALSGSNLSLATAQPSAHTWAATQTLTVPPVFTDQSGSRTALGLGTAAVQNTGTSGANVPLLNGINTWGAAQTFPSAITYGGVTLSNSVTGTGSMVLATAPAVSALTITGSLTATGLVTNAALANPATTVNGQTCTLGSTCTVAAAAGTLTGTTLVATVVTSSLTSVGALAGGSATTGFTINAANVTWSGTIAGVNVATAANASGAPSATFGVVKCDGTTITCASGVITSIGGAATDVAVGTTTVSSGTTLFLLYNNGGLVGNRTIASVLTAGNGVLITGTTNAGIAADIASAANLYAGTASKLVDAAVFYPSEVTVTYGTTTAFDFNTFINAVVTLTGNITTMNCTNMKAGQKGVIRLIQDGTGTRTSVFCSIFKWANGLAPTLSTPLNSVDSLYYECLTTSFCTAALGKAFSWIEPRHLRKLNDNLPAEWMRDAA